MKPFRPQLRTVIKYNTLLLQDRVRKDRNRWRPIARLKNWRPDRVRTHEKLCIRYKRLKLQFARGIDMLKPFKDIFPEANLDAIPVINLQMNQNKKIDPKIFVGESAKFREERKKKFERHLIKALQKKHIRPNIAKTGLEMKPKNRQNALRMDLSQDKQVK